jgi:hypothetical protein
VDEVEMKLDPGENFTRWALLGLYDILYQVILGEEPLLLEEVEDRPS